MIPRDHRESLLITGPRDRVADNGQLDRRGRIAATRRVTVSAPRNLRLVSVIFANQLAAVATVALAVFALAAAILAGLAFWKQSKEVSDQAEALQVQSSRLELQERQFEEQRKINRKRDELLDKQIRESEQLARTLERQQAEAIDLKPGSTMRPVPGYDLESAGRTRDADVANESRRPIRNIACRIEPSPGADLQEARLAGVYFTVSAITFSTGPVRPASRALETAETPSIQLLRAGETCSFVFAVSTEHDPEARVTLRFTDNAGLCWQIDHDLHLEKLDNRDDW